MKFKHIIYGLFSIVYTLTVLTGCSDEVVVPEEPTKPGNNGDGDYTLDVVITLDNMGGRASSTSELTDIENFIDVEKLRVLFFTCVDASSNNDYDHDYFLFETKNHFVKKIDTTNGDNSWVITIPMYTHGNNADSFNWDWDFIRECLTSRSFKIAILANRPDYDYVDEFSGNTGAEVKIKAGYMDNRGPYWGTADAYDGIAANKANWKDVFDLQHCQLDINYVNKSSSTGYYSFVMGDWGYETGRSWSDAYSKSGLGANDVQPKMGATASWVDWDYAKANGKGNEWNFINSSDGSAKRFRHPSYDYPIPMYGIQKFGAIDPDKWIKGTPFYLSSGIPGDYNAEGYTKRSISLLRSVVKMELLIPKSAITAASPLNMVGICYSNIYSRCDPMDTWTPTDSLWNMGHYPDGSNNGNCEIERILNFGSLCDTQNGGSKDLAEFQQKMSWFYGIWDQKGWKFNGMPSSYLPRPTATTPYPRIFNSTIQRNQLVICDDNVMIEEDQYYRYIVYCGERNISDPSGLGNFHSDSPGSSTIQYWLVVLGDDVYAIPVTDYSNKNNPAHNLKPIQASLNDPAYSKDATKIQFGTRTTVKNGRTIYYLSGHQATGTEGTDKPYVTRAWNTLHNDYQLAVTGSPKTKNILPWPLIRNHVYTITLSSKQGNGAGGSATGRSSDGQGKTIEFNVKCEDNFSPKI